MKCDRTLSCSILLDYRIFVFIFNDLRGLTFSVINFILNTFEGGDRYGFKSPDSNELMVTWVTISRNSQNRTRNKAVLKTMWNCKVENYWVECKKNNNYHHLFWIKSLIYYKLKQITQSKTYNNYKCCRTNSNLKTKDSY